MWENVYRLCTNTIPFYIRGFCIHRFWILCKSPNLALMDSERWLYIHGIWEWDALISILSFHNTYGSMAFKFSSKLLLIQTKNPISQSLTSQILAVTKSQKCLLFICSWYKSQRCGSLRLTVYALNWCVPGLCHFSGVSFLSCCLAATDLPGFLTSSFYTVVLGVILRNSAFPKNLSLCLR